MITEQIKTNAIAKIKMSVPLEDISRELDLPLLLIKEWESNLNPRDLVQLKANVHACQTLTQEGDITSSENNEKLLKSKLEDVALLIATEAGLCTSIGDVIQAKNLQLLADTTTKLYNTFINKGTNKLDEPGNNMSLFDALRRD